MLDLLQTWPAIFVSFYNGPLAPYLAELVSINWFWTSSWFVRYRWCYWLQTKLWYNALPNSGAPTNFRPWTKLPGVGDGGRREGGCAASLWWAFAHPPRASQAATRFPGCPCDLLGALVSQFVVLQVDILCRVLDSEEEGHLMCAFPTGYGKSLPMLLLGLLMPEGRSKCLKPCYDLAWRLTF